MARTRAVAKAAMQKMKLHPGGLRFYVHHVLKFRILLVNMFIMYSELNILLISASCAKQNDSNFSQYLVGI